MINGERMHLKLNVWHIIDVEKWRFVVFLGSFVVGMSAAILGNLVGRYIMGFDENIAGWLGMAFAAPVIVIYILIVARTGWLRPRDFREYITHTLEDG